MEALRRQFPIFERLAFLNTGTDGPVPAKAVAAAREALDDQLREGRHGPHFTTRFELQARLREAYAGVLGCRAEDLALTTSTSEGLGAVLGGLELGQGDEIVTSDSEHPGLLGPLIAARRRGVSVTAVPLREVAAAVTERTSLVACSHVSWVTGEIVPDLRDAGVPVVLDGAQGAGAIPVDVRALGCAAYAASGQKWLCGADGTGMLYLEPAFAERLSVVGPSWVSFEDTTRGLDSPLRADARRFDTPSLSREATAFSLTSVRLLEGYDGRHARAAALAGRLATELAERGRTVAARGDTTLVSWDDPDPPATRDRLAEAGVVIRDLPGTGLLRASVGAWNDDADLERLLSAL